MGAPLEYRGNTVDSTRGRVYSVPMAQNDDQNLIDPLDSLLSKVSDDLPIGGNPSTGFAPTAGFMEPYEQPAATPENFICLRGPCVHYWEQKMHLNVGNTRDVLDHAPMLVSRGCMKQPGYYYDLTDETIADCNQWMPQDPDQQKKVVDRREKFYQISKKQNKNLE